MMRESIAAQTRILRELVPARMLCLIDTICEDMTLSLWWRKRVGAAGMFAWAQSRTLARLWDSNLLL